MFQQRSSAAALLLFACLAMACGDNGDGDSVTTSRSITIDVAAKAFSVGRNRGFPVSITESGYRMECTGYPDSKWFTDGTTCSTDLVGVPWTNRVDAYGVGVTCEAPPELGCVATVTPEHGIVLEALAPGAAAIAVTARTWEGVEVTGRVDIAFQDVGAITASHEVFVSPQTLADVFLPNQDIVWCPSAKGPSGDALPLAQLAVTTSGSVEVTDRTYSAANCPILHTRGTGKGTITFAAGTATKSFEVDVAPEEAVTKVEFVAIGTNLASPDVAPNTTSAIAEWQAITSFDLEPDMSGYCLERLAARFTTKDGRVGVTRATDLSYAPGSLVHGIDPLPDQTYQAFYDAVTSAPGPATTTVSATLNGHRADLVISVGNCRSL